MTLRGAGVSFEDGGPFIPPTEADYVTAILQTANAVLTLRASISPSGFCRIAPPQPGLILSAPSLYRHLYQSQPLAKEFADRQIVRKTIRLLQKQTGFRIQILGAELARMLESEPAKAIFQTRAEETAVYALAVGLRAASTVAATLRLPPSVNRAAGAIRQLANHARAPRTPQHKFGRLFKNAQLKLKDSVGEETFAFIERYEGDIKLITDAPLEWLPIRGLTLGLCFHTSRINATPGNLMVGELAMPPLLHLRPEHFKEILLITTMENTDPLRDLVPQALDVFEPLWREKLVVRTVEVFNESDFVNALDSYTGPILIFDGHGGHDIDGVGTLSMGKSDIDVWQLRGRVRVPPIVILSACDTHAADRSHATTANGFLTLGARAVLATLLPISGPSAARFLARLIYRVAEYLPAGIKLHDRSLVWSEVIGGMLRMQAVSDFILPMTTSGLDHKTYQQIGTLANHAINTGDTRWDETFVEIASDHLGITPTQVRTTFQQSIAYSDATRYIQVGNPETIFIGNETEYPDSHEQLHLSK